MSNSIITLLSDLGTRDTSVSAIRAALMTIGEGVLVIDVSHNVVPYDLQQAAYLLLSAYNSFPKGTIHLLLVDVFAGNEPRLLLAEKDGYYFIGPDNGLLPLAFGNEIDNVRLCFEAGKPHRFSDWVSNAGKVISAISKNDLTGFIPADIRVTPRHLQPKLMPDGVDCNILYIDRYENVVLDITRKQFDDLLGNRPFRIKVMRMMDITKVSNSYGDVTEGDPLCRFNNAGFLEIALNHAPAASLLGLGSNNTGNLRHKTIKLFF